MAASKAAPRSTPSARTQGGSQDLRDALLSDDSEPAQSQVADIGPTAEASDEPIEQAEPPINRDDLVDPPMPSTSLPTPSSRTASRKNQDAAAAFADSKAAAEPAEKAGSSLGEIVAEQPNAEFKPKTSAASGSTTTIQDGPATGNSTRPNRGILFTSKQPIISSKIEGPQQIVVGRQAEYRVTVQNTGDVAARELVAAIAAPAGAELVDASASNGTVERAAPEQATTGGEIRWQLYELPAGSSQTLTLQLIPRGGLRASAPSSFRSKLGKQ
jgi:uncharacterized repeat protein (TIGR01451 family)